jgi:hypothetical protein
MISGEVVPAKHRSLSMLSGRPVAADKRAAWATSSSRSGRSCRSCRPSEPRGTPGARVWPAPPNPRLASRRGRSHVPGFGITKIPSVGVHPQGIWVRVRWAAVMAAPDSGVDGAIIVPLVTSQRGSGHQLYGGAMPREGGGTAWLCRHSWRSSRWGAPGTSAPASSTTTEVVVPTSQRLTPPAKHDSIASAPDDEHDPTVRQHDPNPRDDPTVRQHGPKHEHGPKPTRHGAIKSGPGRHVAPRVSAASLRDEPDRCLDGQRGFSGCHVRTDHRIPAVRWFLYVVDRWQGRCSAIRRSHCLLG